MRDSARFLIDLVGYRRYGHNEGDEPAFTQPLLAKKIAEHPTVRSIWAQTQASLGQIPSERADALVKACFSRLEAAYESLKDESPETTRLPDPAPAGVAEGPTRPCRSIGCGLPNDALLVTPPGFTFHKKLERARAKRRDVLADPRAKSVDWTTAEELAFATVLADGIPIRFTGEDAERGTFSQRHAVFHDVLTGKQFVPLQEFKGARVIRDPQQCVVECAAVGFEFGYNVCRLGTSLSGKRAMRDFVNGAQVMLDQFVTSARAKWGLRTSLVFLLPHGYEGQGPEHSSARPERILQSAADFNLRLVNCIDLRAHFHTFGGRRCCSSQTRCRCSC